MTWTELRSQAREALLNNNVPLAAKVAGVLRFNASFTYSMTWTFVCRAVPERDERSIIDDWEAMMQEADDLRLE